MTASDKSAGADLHDSGAGTHRLPCTGPEVSGRRLAVLVNPNAGRGRKRYLDKIVDAFEAEGAAVTVHVSEGAGEAGRRAAEMDGGAVDAVVAAGGDGTINEVANGLAANASPPALAVIPFGTANVFARNLRLPRAPAALARLIAHGPATAFRPGSVNGRLFVAMAGIGFDARVVAGVDTGLKRRVGKAAYVWQALAEMARNRERQLRVLCEGEELHAAGIVAARGPHYGGGFVMAPEARLTRPAFELCCAAGGGTLDIARQGLALGLGRFHRLPGMTLRRTATVEIDGPSDEPVQADGDPVGHLPARIAIAETAIQMIGLPADA